MCLRKLDDSIEQVAEKVVFKEKDLISLINELLVSSVCVPFFSSPSPPGHLLFISFTLKVLVVCPSPSPSQILNLNGNRSYTSTYRYMSI